PGLAPPRAARPPPPPAAAAAGPVTVAPARQRRASLPPAAAPLSRGDPRSREPLLDERAVAVAGELGDVRRADRHRARGLGAGELHPERGAGEVAGGGGPLPRLGRREVVLRLPRGGVRGRAPGGRVGGPPLGPGRGHARGAG